MRLEVLELIAVLSFFSNMNVSNFPYYCVVLKFYIGVQFANLSKLWRRFVIDRYILVLSIFRLHATSKEAKLQVARLLVSLIKHRVENNCLPWYLTEKVLASKGNTIPGSVKRAKGAVTSKEMRRLTVQSLEAKVCA